MAPLKHHDWLDKLLVAGRFPRLQKRGPIEASPNLYRLRYQIMEFPRLQKRGPIEALEPASVSRRTTGFHAYKSVAPLKRENRRHVARWKPTGFHAYKSVAPLKRGQNARAFTRYRRFHAYKSVAPLKLVVAERISALTNGFHAYKSVAPLKRGH